MSTRALFQFIDRNGGVYNIYKHHDGYPEGAVDALKAAIPFAWDLPRFEADEFAAAFVAGNKGTEGGGGVRLLPTGDWKACAPGDLEYVYVVVQYASAHVQVIAYQVSYNDAAEGYACQKCGDLGDGWTVHEIGRAPLKTVSTLLTQVQAFNAACAA